ncbi:hypothetical protein B0H21DRAFT_820303 [Amylocystis lapponica]|nr:hypothetical protein B0H21DRAFT_820303 [Amylocystis lapponica]
MPYWIDTSPQGIEKQHEAILVIVQLLSGITTWEVLLSFPFVCSVVREKRCSWGLWFFYIGCRYLSWVCIIVWMLHLSISVSAPQDGYVYIYRVAYFISVGLASNILTLRIISTCNHGAIKLLMAFFDAGQWVLSTIALARLPKVWSGTIFESFMAAYFTFLVSLLMLTCICDVRRARRQLALPSAHEKADGTVSPPPVSVSLWRQIHDYDLVECVAMWIWQTTHLILCLLAIDSSRFLRLASEMLAFTVIMICACRIYERIVIRNATCPVSHIPYVSKLVKLKTDAAEKDRSADARHNYSGSPALARGRADDIELNVLGDQSGALDPAKAMSMSDVSTCAPSSSTLPSR